MISQRFNSRWAAFSIAAVLAAGLAQGQPARWIDPDRDAVLRPMEASGSLTITSTLPDLLSVTLRGWHPQPDSPYDGREVGPGGQPPALRLDVEFAGLVNPPGELGLFGTYSAFAYGTAPVYGFIEFDVDRDLNTGGELPGSAELRYLANVGRFGTMPAGGRAGRAARGGLDMDGTPDLPPHYERSGQDFSLALCGCHPVEIVQAEGNDEFFSEGETWIVRSRFFQRAGGYAPASTVYGGSNFGSYDPLVNLRFSHDAELNRTTITLVYPLDEIGASLLIGGPVQPLNPVIGFGSHWSVVEALQDLVYSAGQPIFNPLTAAMLAGWENRNPRDYLDPTQWDVRAIVGTVQEIPSDALYVWTDVGFGEVKGDVNGDGSADETDNSLIQQHIALEDGGPFDADGFVNGQVQIFNHGYNFSIFDVNGDGFVDGSDFNDVRVAGCTADWDSDNDVTVLDLLLYLGDWFAQNGDLNSDGVNDTFDLLTYLDAFFVGC